MSCMTDLNSGSGAVGSGYTVACSDGVAIKVNGASGRTWILLQSVDPSVRPAWVPLMQIETHDFSGWAEKEELRAEMMNDARS